MIIKGENVKLRTLRKSDAESTSRLAGAKSVARFTTVPHPYTLQNAYDFIKKTQRDIRKKKGYELVVEYQGKVAGMMSLTDVNYQNKSAELGYWTGEPFRRKGLTKESAKLILKFGFEGLDLERIHARVFTENEASARLLESLGFQYEGKQRKSIFRMEEWHDCYMYSLLKEEYESNQ